ncbi:MAG: CAP domain-containing protein [Spirochaetaceae bacterium]|nr:MAG: CAP domain-containing protein [Spirochaetaceae bacterium]
MTGRRTRLKNAVIAFFAVAAASGAVGPAAAQDTTAMNRSDAYAREIEEHILTLTNAERARRNLPPLVVHTKLDNAARRHSGAMSSQRFFAHVDPRGRNPQDRVFSLYPELIGGIGENIALNHGDSALRTAENIMIAWMNSAGHRRNILSAEYTYIGVGVVAEASGPRYYATQKFGNLIAELTDRAPDSVAAGTEVMLRFMYLGPAQNRDNLSVFVSLPDPRARFELGGGRYMVGAGLLEPRWTGRSEFSIRVPTSSGTGRYTVRMGYNNSYVDSPGITVTAQ